MYHAGRFAAGAVYIVGTNSEKVDAEGVGPGADLYEAFFDRGLLYGSLEKWGSTDIHLSTNGVSGFPVRENTQGAGVQLQYGPFYADVAYRNRQGETGESRIIWHLFETHQVTANAALSLGTALRRHFVRVNLDWQTLRTRTSSPPRPSTACRPSPYTVRHRLSGARGSTLGANTSSWHRIRICVPGSVIRSSTANRR